MYAIIILISSIIGDIMQTLLNDFCFSDKNAGLLLIDMPTGTGKTYNSVEFIYKNYKNVKNKIIFITNLKKNLPIKNLKEFFEKDNKLDDFEKDVLFLDNNVDTLIDHFNEVKNLIPHDRFSKNGTLYNVKRCIKVITTIKDNLSNKSSKELEEFGSKDNAYFIMGQAKEDLKEKYEKEFRALIEEELKYDSEGKRRTKAQKLELIKTDPNYKWISVLYPAVNTDDKKIIFMSIDKFLVRNSTIVEPSYNIIDNKSLLDNSIIFIDEFDASKDILLKSIIKESLDTQVSVVELFRIIYSGLENTSFSKLLTEVSNKLNENIQKQERRFYTPDEILDEFRTRAKEIEKKYKLVNFHKLDASEKDRANFLFQDYQFHTILSDEKNCVYLENDKQTRINWIKKADKKEVLEEENLFALLQAIKSFLAYFQNGVKLLADNYLALKRERKQETNNFSYEASIKTVLSEFGIEGRYLNYLTSQILNTKKGRSNKIVDLKSELDFSVYEKGFRFYNFVDSDTFDTQSKIQLLSFNMSPEKMLIYLCLNSKVIGISASGTLETVTGNYDLCYVKKKLGSLFYEISPEEQDRINKSIMKSLGDYSNVNIDIDKCLITDKNYYDILKSFLSESDYEVITKKIDSYATEGFIKARYCKIVYAIDKFFKRSIHSFLFLTNVSMNSNLDFNYECINYIFNTLKPESCKNAYCYSLEGSLEKFENLKQVIKDRLKLGKRVFVVSTYQTLGAGQNLQYEYDENYEELLRVINDNSYGKKHKDFDALFLDKPTNLFVNMNSKPNEEQLLKFIYQVKCLEEIGHFDLDRATTEIKKAIKILYHASTQKITTPKSKHIYMHTAKIILQAIGRICRTSTKNTNIFISFDQQMETELSYCKEELLSRPINNELKELLNTCENIKTEVDNNLFNINNSKIQKSNDRINSLMQFKSASDIAKWEELRDIVLRHPYDDAGIHNNYDIYCELKEANDHYYYNKNEFGKFNITYEKYNDYCICEELANLKTLMSVDIIKEYFESNGYATFFKKSNYLLLPNVFQRIYLGALGEVVGAFLVNNFLSNVNLKLERIINLDRYEKFDFVFNNDKYVDFKYWSGSRDKDREKEVKRILKKLNDCHGTRGYIINILKPKNYNPKDYVSPDSRLIIIPYLFDPETHQWNREGFNRLL